MHERWVAVHPAVLSFTACVADLITREGGHHEGVVHNIRSVPYLIRMGLFEHVRIDHGIKIEAHEEAGRFIPIHRITNSHDLSDFIVNMIPLLHAEPNQVEPIRYVISEIARNVLEHSQSEGGAFLCAQYFRSSGVLSIGVADAGIGIQRAMTRFHHVPTAWDALILALRPGITGTTARMGGTDYNAGAGLFFTKSIACASRNYFVLYSGDALFKLKPIQQGQEVILYANPLMDHHTGRTDMPWWQGTLVGIDIELERGIMFGVLMRAIRKAFSVDVQKKKKAKFKRPRFV